MNDADAALLRQRDRQARFRDGVHGGADDREFQFDAIGQAGGGADFGGQDVRLQRNDQDVVESIRVSRNLFIAQACHPMTFFEFFAAAAGTGIVSSNLGASRFT